MRSLIFTLTIVTVYAVLRAGSDALGKGVWVSLAMLILLLGFFVWGGGKTSSGLIFRGIRRPKAPDYVVALLLLLVVETVSIATVMVSSEVVIIANSSLLEKKSGDGPVEEGEEGVGDRLWEQGFEREIPKSSDHKLPNRPEVFVEALSDESFTFLTEEKVYLQGFSFDQYRDDHWGSSERIKKILRNDAGTVVLGRAVDSLKSIKHRVHLNSSGTEQNVEFSIQGTLEVKQPQLRQVAKGVLLLPESKGGEYVYDALSQPRILEYIETLGVDVRAGSPGPSYLQLPRDSELKQRWSDLLADLKKGATVSEKLKSIRMLLRDRCSYSLKVENPQALSSMENFLFAEKKGYCEHFASAAALFCRELSIPSRVAYGYAGGTVYPYSKMMVFRARDAHAWTEVYLEGYGWTVFDTTPSSEVTKETAKLNEQPPEWEQKVKVSEKPPKPKLFNWWPVAITCVGLILCLLVAVYLKSKENNRSTGSRGRRNLKEEVYLKEFLSVCRALGIRSFDTLTLQEIIKELPEKPDFCEQMEAYHNGVVYRGAEVDKSIENALLKKIRHWRASLPIER